MNLLTQIHYVYTFFKKNFSSKERNEIKKLKENSWDEIIMHNLQNSVENFFNPYNLTFTSFKKNNDKIFS